MRVVSQLPARADLVVVGGGIVGAATAFFASRAGLRVLLVERLPRPAAFTTAVAAGGYRLQLEHPDELGLVQRTVDLLERFGDETGQTAHTPGLLRQGYLWLASTEETAAAQRELVGRQREFGVDGVELLGGDEARREFPWLDPSVLQARYRAADGLIDPRPIAMGLIEGAGCEVALGCDVTELVVNSGRVQGVRTSWGDIPCGGVVIACGPLSGLLAERAGVRLPVEALRRQRVALWNLAGLPPGAPMTIDEETTVHWRPVGDRGAYLLYPDPDERPAAPATRVVGDPEFAFGLLDPASPRWIGRTAPFWAEVWERNSAVWSVQAGQYTMTPDQRPLLDETEVGGLFVNTGYSGHGVMAGPGGSELLVEVITGERTENPFRIDRSFTASTQAF